MLSSSVLLTLSTGLAAALAVWGLVKWWRSTLSRLPYPPGPPVKNIISGNLVDVPAHAPWLKYTEWKEAYGNVVHFRVYGQHVVVLNSVEEAIEIFEKRSNIYSDRPHNTMVDLMGWDFNSGLKPYGDEWRQHRRILQHLFKREESLTYRPIQTRKVNDLLYGLLTAPEDFLGHARTVAAAIIVSAMYDLDIEPKGDFFVGLAEAAVSKLSESVFPGALAVNALPIIRFLPEWFPGAGFKRFARGAKELTDQMLAVPIESVKRRMTEGTSVLCAVATLLESDDSRNPETYDAIKHVAATAYAAGADTTVSAIETFMLAMAMFPEAQKKAQAEIDAVIGNDRMPNFEDRPSLQYVEALFREVLRWRPVLPLGVPHAAGEEDIYNGYYIPKGTHIIPNVWAIAHDRLRYDRPHLFDPQRFLQSDGTLNDDDVLYAFGFGRRVCPGRHMASATVWLSVATTLALFNIQRKRNASGAEIFPSGEYWGGLVVHPVAFDCAIVPRSDNVKKIVLDALEDGPRRKNLVV